MSDKIKYTVTEKATADTRINQKPAKEGDELVMTEKKARHYVNVGLLTNDKIEASKKAMAKKQAAAEKKAAADKAATEKKAAEQAEANDGD